MLPDKISIDGRFYYKNDLPWLTDIPLDELRKKVYEVTSKFIPYEEYFVPYIKGNNCRSFDNYSELSKCLNDKIDSLEISNCGSIKLGGEILKPTYVKDGPHKGFWYGKYDSFLEINFDVDYPFNNWLFLVHRLVAETWCVNKMPEYYQYVHHIINDGANNRFCNLLWVTKEQHDLIHKYNNRFV
jgi:hypothetical protein